MKASRELADTVHGGKDFHRRITLGKYELSCASVQVGVIHTHEVKTWAYRSGKYGFPAD